MRTRAVRPWIGAIAHASLCLAVPAVQATPNELADLSLEELSNIEVTSVSRRAERLGDAQASVYVISADQIRRSGQAV